MGRGRDNATRDLFPAREEDPAPASLEFGNALRHELSAALKECPESRYVVAARMSEFLGVQISKAQLDAWTAESKLPWRFPFEYGPAFEFAARTARISDLYGRYRGRPFADPLVNAYAALGAIEAEQAHLTKKRKELRAFIQGKKT